MSTELSTEIQSMEVEELRKQVNLIQRAKESVMKENEHYGLIPGCGNKPALYKAGAEKLLMLFKLTARYTVQEKLIGNEGHREYQVNTELYTRDGVYIGAGVGFCSTLESKYRWRKENKLEPTGRAVPKEYWADKDAAYIGGNGYTAKKDADGKWMVFKVAGQTRVENTDISDVINTVLKMSKKRSLVDAVLTCTASSDFFTQDIEENAPVSVKQEPEKAENGKEKAEKKDGGDAEKKAAGKKKSEKKADENLGQKENTHVVENLTALDELTKVIRLVQKAYKPIEAKAYQMNAQDFDAELRAVVKGWCDVQGAKGIDLYAKLNTAGILNIFNFDFTIRQILEAIK